MIDIRINKPVRPEIRLVGNEKTPVVIIDDPIESTGALIRYAIENATFEADPRSAYPGIRTALPAGYAQALLPELIEVINDVYQPPLSHEFRLIHQLFSLVTKKPGELAPLQCAPHFDTNNPFYFATVHYLSPGDYAGTGLFRHRPTGFESISAERFPIFARAAEQHVKTHGWPGGKYINASDDHFEMIAEIEYRPNRLIMYPGNVLHSGLIQPDRDINADPATGRLTANLFLNFAPSG